MPALSRSTIVQLVGFDANLVASELIQGESWISDIIFSQPTGRSVVSVAGNVVTFTGGDNSVFTIGQFATFVDDANAFQITGIGVSTITLATAPNSRISGDAISQSFNLPTGTTFLFRATQYLSSGITESRGTLDLGTVSLKMPENDLVFDTNVQVVDATKSWIRLALPGNAFASAPPTLGDTPGGVTYIIFAGFLTLNQPASTTTPLLNPATSNTQRFVWLISSKLSV